MGSWLQNRLQIEPPDETDKKRGKPQLYNTAFSGAASLRQPRTGIFIFTILPMGRFVNLRGKDRLARVSCQLFRSTNLVRKKN